MKGFYRVWEEFAGVCIRFGEGDGTPLNPKPGGS